MIQDRTYEFRSAISTISGGRFAISGSSYANNVSANLFLDKSTKISKEIFNLNSKLEQLKKLAKNKSIFDDKPQEFDDLSNSIKRDLSLINKRVHELKDEQLVNIDANQRSKSYFDHQKNITVILQTRAAQSFKSFETILEIRSETLKTKKDRKSQFGSGFGSGATISGDVGNNVLSSVPTTNSMNSSSSSSSPTKTSAPVTKQRPVDQSIFAMAPISHIDQGGDPTAPGYKKSDDSHVSIDFSNQQQILQMEQESLLGSDSKTLRVRNNALNAIESTINELGSIYQQLAHMIAEQGEVVQRIDMNIEDMSVNVQRGQDQLARYLRRVSSNRWLIAKLFIGLIIFIIIFKILFL